MQNAKKIKPSVSYVKFSALIVIMIGSYFIMAQNVNVFMNRKQVNGVDNIRATLLAPPGLVLFIDIFYRVILVLYYFLYIIML